MVHHFSILIKLETQLDRNYWGNDNLLIRNIFVHLKNLRKVEEKKREKRKNKQIGVRPIYRNIEPRPSQGRGTTSE